MIFIPLPGFKIKIEIHRLGEWISPLFQVDNQGRNKDFGVTDAGPKFIIVFLFGYKTGGGDSFTLSLSLSLSLLRRAIDGILEMVCLNLH